MGHRHSKIAEAGEGDERSAKLQRVCTLAGLGRREVRALRLKFRRIDRDHSGDIDAQELFQWLGVRRTPFTDGIFSLIDADGSTALGFDAFAACVATLCLFERGELLKLVYCQGLDGGRRGALSLGELGRLVEQLHGNDGALGSNERQALQLVAEEKWCARERSGGGSGGGDGGGGGSGGGGGGSGGDDGGEEDALAFAEFVAMNVRFPRLLLPAFVVQQRLASHTFGQRWWRRRREALCRQRSAGMVRARRQRAQAAATLAQARRRQLHSAGAGRLHKWLALMRARAAGKPQGKLAASALAEDEEEEEEEEAAAASTRGAGGSFVSFREGPALQALLQRTAQQLAAAEEAERAAVGSAAAAAADEARARRASRRAARQWLRLTRAGKALGSGSGSGSGSGAQQSQPAARSPLARLQPQPRAFMTPERAATPPRDAPLAATQKGVGIMTLLEERLPPELRGPPPKPRKRRRKARQGKVLLPSVGRGHGSRSSRSATAPGEAAWEHRRVLGSAPPPCEPPPSELPPSATARTPHPAATTTAATATATATVPTVVATTAAAAVGRPVAVTTAAGREEEEEEEEEEAEEEEGPACPICLEQLPPRALTMPCGHTFCLSCVRGMRFHRVSAQCTCPLCRRAMPDEQQMKAQAAQTMVRLAAWRRRHSSEPPPQELQARAGGVAALLRRALAIDPGDAKGHFLLGYALAHGGGAQDADGAISAYRRGLQLEPADGAAHFNLGVLLEGTAQYGEAERAWRRAIELDADDVGALLNLGALLEAQCNDEAGAERAYRRAVQLGREQGSRDRLQRPQTPLFERLFPDLGGSGGSGDDGRVAVPYW